MKYLYLLLTLFNVHLATAQSLPKLFFPATGASTYTGKSVGIYDLNREEKPIFLIFWSTTDPVSIRFLSEVHEIYPEWQKKYDMKVIAIATDKENPYEAVREVMKTKPWKFEVLVQTKYDVKKQIDSRDVFNVYVAHKGKLVYNKAGYPPLSNFQMDRIYERIKANRTSNR